MALPVPEPAVSAGTLITKTGDQKILVTGSANTVGVVIGNGTPNGQ